MDGIENKSGINPVQILIDTHGADHLTLSAHLLKPDRNFNMFIVGNTYNRKRELHDVYGGQRQGGISTPADLPFIFLFTGESGEEHGYADGWNDDGVFAYSGEGQHGDMEFLRGNLAIRDHSTNGKILHLFQSLGKGSGYRYLGEFVCSTWSSVRSPDTDGNERSAIVFHLVPLSAFVDQKDVDPGVGDEGDHSLENLRANALTAVEGTQTDSKNHSKRIVYQRSLAVKKYVLARAGGICELCGSPAPFKRKSGSLYLEPHHTRRISDGGPDHPRWVGALCPNCHREIHSGELGDEKNQQLMDRLSALESEI